MYRTLFRFLAETYHYSKQCTILFAAVTFQ